MWTLRNWEGISGFKMSLLDHSWYFKYACPALDVTCKDARAHTLLSLRCPKAGVFAHTHTLGSKSHANNDIATGSSTWCSYTAKRTIYMFQAVFLEGQCMLGFSKRREAIKLLGWLLFCQCVRQLRASVSVLRHASAQACGTVVS